MAKKVKIKEWSIKKKKSESQCKPSAPFLPQFPSMELLTIKYKNIYISSV